MAKTASEPKWEKVSFTEKQPEYKVTFRTNGQIVLSADTVYALGKSKYIALYHSPSDRLIAMGASGKDDGDAIRVTKHDAVPDGDIVFTCKKVYAWIGNLIGNYEVVITLFGEAKGDKVVFDLSKAVTSSRQPRKKKTEG